MVRHGIVAGGYFEGSGVLQRELDNPVNSDAVIVLLEGERIGYAPSYAADLLPVSATGSLVVPLRFFTVHDGRRRWTRAFVWLDSSLPRWSYSESSPPPLTSAEKAQAHASATSQMVNEALAGGGRRADEFRAGMVDGIHYLELVEPIKELKRQSRNDEALELIYMAIRGAEGDREDRAPAPWYTEQAAIVHRKLGQRDEEIAVLRRWLAFVPEESRSESSLGQRLSKLRPE